MMFYVYMLLCADGTYYTGYTTDLQRRLNKHNSGKGAKYTRGRRPCKMVWSCPFETKSKAMRNEYALKQMTRKDKIRFIKMSNDALIYT